MRDTFKTEIFPVDSAKNAITVISMSHLDKEKPIKREFIYLSCLCIAPVASYLRNVISQLPNPFTKKKCLVCERKFKGVHCRKMCLENIMESLPVLFYSIL